MNQGGYDDLGPRIDLSDPAQEPREFTRQNPAAPPAPAYYPESPAGGGGGGGKVLGGLALLVSLCALGLAAWGVFLRGPESSPPPALSPQAVPGATAERVAKLEKDAGSLMLRLVTLEKELEALRAKAGPTAKLMELSAKVAALQERLDGMGAEARAPRRPPAEPEAARPAAKAAEAPRPAAEAAKPRPAAEAAKPRPEPVAQAPAPAPAPSGLDTSKLKKHSYTVRQGDSLFNIAARYKITVGDLMKWNDLKRGDVLVSGRRLTIYLPD